eukprot:Skav225742  [mRNA]  locus=scaffold28:61584:69007:+ [translate_table: standard]
MIHHPNQLCPVEQRASPALHQRLPSNTDLQQQRPQRVLENVAHPAPGSAARGHHTLGSCSLEPIHFQDPMTEATVFFADGSLDRKSKSMIPMLPTQPSHSIAFRGTFADIVQPPACLSARTLFLRLQGTGQSCETFFFVRCTCHMLPTPPIQRRCNLSALGHHNFASHTLRSPSKDLHMGVHHSRRTA